MERILFIIPPNLTYKDYVDPPENVKVVTKGSHDYGAVITDISVGVLSLSAYVKKHATVETRLVDFNIVLNKIEDFKFNSFLGLFRDFLSARQWVDYQPSIVAISALFAPSYQSVLDIAKCCRDIFPNAIIVAGGGVPTNMYKEIFSESASFNALCYGEGEKPLLGLLKANDKLQYLEEDPTWITQKKSRQEQVSFRYSFIENLDEIPFYDYGLYNTDEYGLNPTISAYTSVNGKNKNIPVLTSRGCTFCCCFCSSHTVHGRKMRYHSISRVKEDLTRFKHEYGVKVIVFEDDHFMSDRQRAFEIIRIMRELELSAFFPNSLALYTLDRKMLEALKEAGVNQLVLSVESGSNRVLKEIMHKPLNLSIVKRVVSDCRDLGIYTDVNILIGLPGETKKDIEDTRLFLKTINGNWFRVNVATPLVGTKMFEICKKNNYFKGNYLDSNLKRAVIETEDFSAEYIQEMAYILNLELNFVENSDYKLGNYAIALKGFEVAIKAKSDHALAYYYAGKCYEKLGNLDKAQEYINTAKTLVSENPFWRKYADIYKILTDAMEKSVEVAGPRPLVSVIVALYNSEQYLKCCVDSIINQSYKHIEVILVNDGSTDNSAQICDSYARSDARVRVIHSKNNGPAQARNIGIDNSSGDFVFFIDSDDFIENNALSLLIHSYNQSKADIIIGDANSIKDNMPGAGYKGVFPGNKILTKEDIVDYTMTYLKKPNKFTLFAYSWGRLFKASIIKNNRVYFNAGLRTYEDVDFNYNYLQYAQSAYFEKVPIYNHLIHYHYMSATMAVTDNPRTLLGYQDAIASIGRFLERRAFDSGVINREAGHALVCLTIIQLVRACGQINSGNRTKIYGFIREIINEQKLRDNLKYYKPSGSDSRVIPILMRLRLVWPLISLCRYKANRRYGKGCAAR